MSATFRPVMVIDRWGRRLLRPQPVDRPFHHGEGRSAAHGGALGVVGRADAVQGHHDGDLPLGELAREPVGDRDPVAEQHGG